MPRRHRRQDEPDDLDLNRLTVGFRKTEQRRGRTWSVQPISAANAQKVYRCPGCDNEVAVGVAHVVVWAEDGLFGSQADIADRRHWHSHCWRVF